jgi:hypothetical protein
MYKRLLERGTFFISFLFLFGLAACSSSTPAPNTQPPSFTQYAPINLDVARIDMIEEYKSPFAAPNVEHLMPYTPADSVTLWVKDRLRATGHDKILQVTIKDASVKSIDLPKTQGLTGLFTNDQDKKYDGRLEVEMRIYGDQPMSLANTSVVVTRSITIPENASPNVRKSAYIQMVQDMLKTLNDKLELNIRSYMGNYINR